MSNYTVILMRPDYMADSYGTDTFMAHVSTPSVEAAVHQARVQAIDADFYDDDENEVFENHAMDYAVIAVFGGHLTDVNPEV